MSALRDRRLGHVPLCALMEPLHHVGLGRREASGLRRRIDHTASEAVTLVLRDLLGEASGKALGNPMVLPLGQIFGQPIHESVRNPLGDSLGQAFGDLLRHSIGGLQGITVALLGAALGGTGRDGLCGSRRRLLVVGQPNGRHPLGVAGGKSVGDDMAYGRAIGRARGWAADRVGDDALGGGLHGRLADHWDGYRVRDLADHGSRHYGGFAFRGLRDTEDLTDHLVGGTKGLIHLQALGGDHAPCGALVCEISRCSQREGFPCQQLCQSAAFSPAGCRT